MFLILAIEPDRRQASRLGAIARGPLRNAELLTVDSVEAALALLARRVPDLVLTSMLLSPKDDTALAERLRELDTAGRQVQTLVIPMFAAPRKSGEGGLLARFTKSNDEGASHGCQPAVFAAQLNEYLDDLQLDQEAREMRQPYSATPAETLYQQPTVSDPYQEIVASVPAEQVIVPEPTMAPPASAAMPPTLPPTVVKERPPRIAEPPQVVERPDAAEPVQVAEPAYRVEPQLVAEAAHLIEPQRVHEPPLVVDPRALEMTPAEDAPTAEPHRLIAPSPSAESRRSVGKPPRTEPIVKSADHPHDQTVAEPWRLIAPSPVAEPSPEAPPLAAHAAEPKSPPTSATPVSRPAATAATPRAKPKVAKVQFVPPPLHEDPEVAKFMAALNDLPMADVVETTTEEDAEAPHVEQTAAAATAELDVDVTLSLPRSRQIEETVTPREIASAPKIVKALKPARARALSPAAAPPSLPASARKRVTPIRRGTSAPAQPDPAPEAPPAIEERPATTSAPVKVVGRIQPAAAATTASPGARTAKQKGSARRARPLQDEWGFFDPDQAGLPAVQAALEQIEEPDIFRNVGKPPKPRA